jgi:hypothetical protein
MQHFESVKPDQTKRKLLSGPDRRQEKAGAAGDVCFDIAFLPSDGIGPEVVDAMVAVLKRPDPLPSQ